MTRDEEIDIRKSEVQTIIQRILGLSLDRMSVQTTTIPGSTIHIEIHLPNFYRNYKNTNYYFNGSSIIHFTNINAAFSILDSGCLWLQNLYIKNDKKEFTYVSDILHSFCKTTESYFYNLENEIKAIKENAFILSTTSSHNINKFWDKEYTEYGRGVGFEFSFCNNTANWEGFFMSKIIYGDIERFVKLYDELIGLKTKNNSVDYKLNLNPIIPFHKEAIQEWRNEDEIRILTTFPKDNNIDVFMKSDDNKSKLIKLPILSKTPLLLNCDQEKIPFFKLERIYLGPKLNDDEKRKIQQICDNNFFNKIDLKSYND